MSPAEPRFLQGPELEKLNTGQVNAKTRTVERLRDAAPPRARRGRADPARTAGQRIGTSSHRIRLERQPKKRLLRPRRARQHYAGVDLLGADFKHLTVAFLDGVLPHERHGVVGIEFAECGEMRRRNPPSGRRTATKLKLLLAETYDSRRLSLELLQVRLPGKIRVGAGHGYLPADLERRGHVCAQQRKGVEGARESIGAKPQLRAEAAEEHGLRLEAQGRTREDRSLLLEQGRCVDAPQRAEIVGTLKPEHAARSDIKQLILFKAHLHACWTGE